MPRKNPTPPDPHPVLNEARLLQLMGHALRRAFLRMSDVASAGMEAGGLSMPEFVTLALLLDNHRASQKSVVRTLCIDPANLANLLHRLEDRNLVRRVANRKDRRVRGLELTAEGRRKAERAFGTVKALEKKFIRTLSAPEQRTLLRLLRKLTQSS